MLCIFNDAKLVKQVKPDLNALANLSCRGIILSAPALDSDVYSRCFYPGCDVPEDPVTGSAHCVIAPYWCEISKDRVLLSGHCQLYLQGEILVPALLKEFAHGA